MTASLNSYVRSQEEQLISTLKEEVPGAGSAFIAEKWDRWLADIHRVIPQQEGWIPHPPALLQGELGAESMILIWGSCRTITTVAIISTDTRDSVTQLPRGHRARRVLS